MYNVHCALYIVHCAAGKVCTIVNCALCIMHCTSLNVHRKCSMCRMLRELKLIKVCNCSPCSSIPVLSWLLPFQLLQYSDSSVQLFPSELCGLPQKESMHNIADIKLRQMFGETIHGTRNIYGMDAITVGREEKHLPCQNICMCRKRPSWRACGGIKSTLKTELG